MLTLTSPVDTWAHAVPAGVKLAVLCGFTVVLFAISGIWPVCAAAASVVALTVSGGWVFATSALNLLRPLRLFVVIVLLWHGWLGDLTGGAEVALRLVTAMAAANFVTMTTRLADMMAVVIWLCQPLARIGVNPRLIGLAMALVVRFVPVMMQRMAQIDAAFRARSARRPGWRVLVPAVLAALDDADQIAQALQSRGGAV